MFNDLRRAVRLVIGAPVWLALVGAVAMTVTLSALGIDAHTNSVARRQDRWPSIAWSAFPLLGGFVAPVAAPVLLWRNPSTRPLARPTLVAVTCAFVLNLLLKAVTGRASPEAPIPADLVARSQAFSIGLARGGVVEGWPSGHAMANVAMASAVIAGTRDKRTRAFVAAWAAWVCAAVVFGISGDVHWLSDGVSGALLGAVIGWRVGRHLRASPRGSSPPA